MTVDSPFAHDWVLARAESHDAAIGTPDDGWIDYAGLASMVGSVAATLVSEGVRRGDFVVHSLTSSAVSVAVSLAIQSIGACCVEVSRDMGAVGLSAVLGQTEARWLLCEARDVPLWSGVVAGSAVRHVWVRRGEPVAERVSAALAPTAWSSLESALAAGAPPVAAARLDADDMALLVYTSGSTGTPRAVIQTHRNVAANTAAISRYLALTATDRALATLPLYYCYGRSVLQTHLYVGAAVFFDHRFMYPRTVMEEIGAQRCTGFAGVPLTFESLKRTIDPADLDLGSLRYLTQAGGAMHPDTIRWVREAFAPAVLFVMYGQTEATARLTYLPPERAADKVGSVGRAVDNVDLRIVDDEGRDAPTGSVGNVVASGPSITPGYFRAPEETAQILRDGRLWTGDLGRLDEDGFLFIEGRTKEFLKLAGNRVSPLEIEEVVARHPGVDSVAVVGVADDVGAEHAVAVVVPRDGADVDEESLRRHCRAALPAFKVPEFVRFVETLPRTPAGKLARAELQKRIRDDRSVLERRPAP